MSYNDVGEWAEETIPPQLYDSFQEWINAIEEQFAKDGHFFPDGMIDNLRELWEEKFDYELSDNEVNQEREIATEKVEGLREIELRKELAEKFKRQEKRIEREKQIQRQERIQLSKRQKRRQNKPKFQKKLSRKERKKRRFR